MEYSYSFEKLEVWQCARKYVRVIYALTATFPKNETFGLSSQLRRAVVSIPSNIAEGSSRSSIKDQIRFTEIAYGSALETYCQLTSAFDLNFITELQYSETKQLLQEITNKLNALRNSKLLRLNKDTNSPNFPNNQITK